MVRDGRADGPHGPGLRRLDDRPTRPGIDPDDIKRANDRLSRLDVFRALRIQEADQIRPDGRLPLTVVVQERQLHRFGIGAGFSTLDGAQFETYWLTAICSAMPNASASTPRSPGSAATAWRQRH